MYTKKENYTRTNKRKGKQKSTALKTLPCPRRLLFTALVFALRCVHQAHLNKANTNTKHKATGSARQPGNEATLPVYPNNGSLGLVNAITTLTSLAKKKKKTETRTEASKEKPRGA